MLRILLASRNTGKLREFSTLLPDLPFVLWPAAIRETPGSICRPSAIPSDSSFVGAS